MSDTRSFDAGDFDAGARERELRSEAAAWDTSATSPAEAGDIPTVDVGPWFERGDDAALHTAAAVLRDACERVGFHQLVGHGVTSDEIDDIFGWARAFHDLPDAEKVAILMDSPEHPVGGCGWMPVGERKLPRRTKGNLNEAFLVKRSHELGFDDNRWLADDVLPGFRAAVEGWADRMEALALRLLPVWAVALDLEPDFFSAAFESPFQRLRLTRYPADDALSGQDVDGAFGIAPHVDTTFFTLLLQDGAGLSIFHAPRQQWIDVPHVPGAFVVNSGELLRTWSNDRVLSTRHFANNSADRVRHSIPFFFNATADFPMSCLPTCHGPGNPPRYPTISYAESQAVAQGE